MSYKYTDLGKFLADLRSVHVIRDMPDGTKLSEPAEWAQRAVAVIEEYERERRMRAVDYETIWRLKDQQGRFLDLLKWLQSNEEAKVREGRRSKLVAKVREALGDTYL